MIAEIFVLALAAAVSPAIFAAVALILTRPRPMAPLAAYYAGALTLSVCAGMALVAGLGQTHLADSKSGFGPALNFSIGGLALLAAWWVWTGRAARRKAELKARSERRRERKHPDAEPARAPDRDPWMQRVLDRGSLPLAFLVGVIMNLPGGFYLVALKDIAQGHHRTGGELALVIGFNLVMLAPIEVPLVLYLVRPEQTLAALGRFSAWLDIHSRDVVVGVATLAGAYLVLRGTLEIL